jgi:hypothetical protein
LDPLERVNLKQWTLLNRLPPEEWIKSLEDGNTMGSATVFWVVLPYNPLDVYCHFGVKK